ncbi:hypothetical protein PFICI_14771 [Pestalotiopsis fici W106-1]|uniref:1-alkyl-2-acetylglycerophosphocholine esterase n=1 Tax=Pestalotiopsis fici (strain W106-1 / CGMCC3.15140) TaxID=1229662 RepID=W3WIT0_PESFW|nr:uncharacterized protein PFICI_14771 [Pestalotiopsis fici W106-1]ETS73825.1 hypothetical protein PFICI_14771 [Pestalotiopsis fici W106-1]
MKYLHFFFLLQSAVANAVTLPTPNGPFSVGLFTTALSDTSRMDPYAPADAPRLRKLMVSVFMPMDNATSQCVPELVPYMTPLVAADYDILAMSAGLPNGTFSELNMKLCKSLPLAGCARGRRDIRRAAQISRPLLLFSPGFGQSRLVYNAMAQSLASEGYIVASIDHPYDANVVEYPDGSYVTAANISSDDIAALNALLDAPLRRVIGHSGNVINFEKLVMYGHSLGGATAATLMLTDSRIRGGINLDGRFFDKVLATGVSAPFINVGRPNHRLEDTTWDSFYNISTGPIIELEVSGSLHAAFTDFPAVIGTMNLTNVDVIETVQAFVGTIPWERAGDIITRVVTDSAEFVFDHRNSTVLSGTDSSFPEVELVRGHGY